MLDLLNFVMPALPADRPTHLLGIADATSMEAAVRFGVDSFDSCYPTRLGRHGTLLTRNGPVKLKSGKWRNDHSLIDPEREGGGHSFAYLHHLVKRKKKKMKYGEIRDELQGRIKRTNSKITNYRRKKKADLQLL